MQKSYIIIDFLGLIDENLSDYESFTDLVCIGYYKNFQASLNAIISKKPQLVFFHFSSDIPLTLIYELNQYLDELPYFIAVNGNENNAYSALKHGVSDYLLFPFKSIELQKSILKFNKLSYNVSTSKLCIRSNGDHHFIPFEKIVYLKADNNTTDFILHNESVVHGFKTLKYFEGQLPFYFFRIHHSFIVNINFISRINLGKCACYLSDNTITIPFSRTYKDQIDLIIKRMG
ncbi:LytR/AlgR family response regulator transcription factor [Flavobacterium tegetincola]|uniref:LytR/AlgR family response regulator transcription factor n=1 Tax=Flavobacterium tegetincola TaxID=150172 RepID=UPI000427AB7B|nr:LytTR family DNA-binding domain-containing protein [Flavobacterium tegetincola]